MQELPFDPLHYLREMCNCEPHLDSSSNIQLDFKNGCGLEQIMNAQTIVRQYRFKLTRQLMQQISIATQPLYSKKCLKPNTEQNKTTGNFAA